MEHVGGYFFMRLAFLLSLSPVVYGQASHPVETSYDKAENQTLFIASSPIRLQPSAEDRLAECRLRHPDDLHRFEVTYRCPGEASGCPNGNLVIKFSFCTSSWTFNTVQVGLTIDGKPIMLPPSMHPNSVLAAWVLDDAVSVELPVAAVRGLSADSEIQATLGAYTYRLSGANLDTLRNVAERIR
jgi:hypothetical protein